MAIEDPAVEEIDLGALITDLEGPLRRRRQEAAHVIALVAKDRSDELLDSVEVLIEALQRPEAQTRWEILSALGEVALDHADLVSAAYEGAEASLFDEDSAIVRLAAFRFLSRLGASAPDQSDLAWPLLNEAVQCYHGDPEYRDMLVALVEFAHGDLSDAARSSLIDRISFDAENGHGYVRALSAEIVEAAEEGAV